MSWGKWVQEYVILNGETGDYFGEFVKDGDQRLPCGTGVFYHSDDKTYEMYEHYDPKTERASGMFFGHRSREQYADGTGNIFNDFYAGFLEDGRVCGDALNMTSGKEHRVEYSYYGQNGQRRGPVITVFHDGGYVIDETRDGEFTGRAYRYRHGRLMLETYSREMSLCHKVIDCGKDFEIRRTYMCPPYYFGNGMTTGFCPAIVTKLNTSFEYRGAVQTIGEKQEYIDLPNGDRIFTNQVRNDFGIIPRKNGDKFFGEVKPEGKGDYSVTGFACLRRVNGACYIGQLTNGREGGLGLWTDDKTAIFGSFSAGKLYGGGFCLTEVTTIYSYKNGIAEKHYFVIDEDFNLTEYDGKNVIQKIIFDDEVEKNPHGVDDDVPNEEKINLNEKEKLDALGLTYEVDDEENIWLTGVTEKELPTFQELHIPGFVKGIRQGAFRGIKGLRLVEALEGFKIIEAEAFRDCPDIKELTLPRTVKTIGSHAFTTKKLEVLHLLDGCERLCTQSFRACTGLKKVLLPSACIVENEALPPRFDDINGENFDEKKIEEKEKREKKRKEHNEKIANKARRQYEKRERRKKNHNALPAIGKFFAAIGSGLLAALLFIPKKIWQFLCFIGGAIAEFFTDTIPDAFRGALRGLGYFFRRLGEGFVAFITFPFRMLFRFFGGFTSSASGIWGLVGILMCALTMVLGCTGCLYYIAEGSSDFMSHAVPSVFGFRLLFGAVDLFESLYHEQILLALLSSVLVLLGLIVDLVLNLLWAIVAAILGILYLIFGSVFIYGGGVLILAPSVVGMIIAAKDGDDKGVPTLSLIIGIVCCIIYYMSMTVFYGPV